MTNAVSKNDQVAEFCLRDRRTATKWRRPSPAQNKGIVTQNDGFGRGGPPGVLSVLLEGMIKALYNEQIIVIKYIYCNIK